ncbi:aspartate/glutamate racemase family protein [Ferdinandcohnia quinoae]|uniref:Amino acid racemase n=1 Tax=Fredinandcohnia quinoae TaxID=2918902 RepID=A0AAW5E4Z7_9BACI|nr:amino acid racemase [Fredinandcohnia sp. SECRCQ15]MCH1625909.1 amino acid racemase [Fredinandcohnia sp. SECRCQ15]
MKLGVNMEDRSLGVIGGMGPKATSVFFEKIVENTEAHKDQDHINMIILNHATLPDRTTAILTNNDHDFLNVVEHDIKLLEGANVSHIAIPCNTSHYFYDRMQAMTSVPIIHMVDETMKKIYEKYGEHTKIGIMATSGTISSGIYKKTCDKYNMELQIPNQLLQDQIMDIIYNKVKSDLKVEIKEIDEIVFDFINNGCSCVILACTELSCIKLSEDVQKYCIDAMDVLVEKSIELSGKKRKQS